MKFIPLSYAADEAEISKIFNPAINFTPGSGSKISDLFKSSNGIDVVNLIFIIIGILFFANLVLAGWDFMLSTGDPKKAALASARITNGLIGLVMAFTAYLIVKIITTLLGLGVNI
jgi:hypothetical protein